MGLRERIEEMDLKSCRRMIVDLEELAEEVLFPAIHAWKEMPLLQGKRVFFELIKPNVFHPNFDGEASVSLCVLWPNGEDSLSGEGLLVTLRPKGKVTVTGAGPKPVYADKKILNHIYLSSEIAEGVEPISVEADMNEAGWKGKLQGGVLGILCAEQTMKWERMLSEHSNEYLLREHQE